MTAALLGGQRAQPDCYYEYTASFPVKSLGLSSCFSIFNVDIIITEKIKIIPESVVLVHPHVV